MTEYRQRTYLLMTLDPVHPGAGGYRLGRVDNSIVREPGTRLPKIPGSSLHGAVRQYADLQAREKGKTETCAGQNSCGKPDCPICYTFGHIKGDAPASGVVSIYDARLLLFPVHTLNGPYWVSTAQRREGAGFKNTPGSPKDGEVILTRKPDNLDRLNLGGLLLDALPSPPGRGAGGEGLPSPSETRAESAALPSPPGRGAGGEGLRPPSVWAQDPAWEQVAGRLAIVSESLFPAIVNSNLEVRTSVAINPETGAAEEGALFTYEAIPRAAFLTCDVVLDDYRSENFPSQNGWANPLEVVRAGLKMMQYLGVGGMGTRGFGRLRLVGGPVETSFLEEQP